MPRRSYTMKMVEDKRGGCLGGGRGMLLLIILVIIILVAVAR